MRVEGKFRYEDMSLICLFLMTFLFYVFLLQDIDKNKVIIIYFDLLI